MAEVEGLFVAVVKGRKKKGLEAAAYANVFVSVCVCVSVLATPQDTLSSSGRCRCDKSH